MAEGMRCLVPDIQKHLTALGHPKLICEVLMNNPLPEIPHLWPLPLSNTNTMETQHAYVHVPQSEVSRDKNFRELWDTARLDFTRVTAHLQTAFNGNTCK